jgi:hypothetical protein
MAAIDMIGWLAAGVTLLTFSVRSMTALRVAAIAANFCFIAYGALASIYPVLGLHLLLLPCNALRLRQLMVHPQYEEQAGGDTRNDPALNVPRCTRVRSFVRSAAFLSRKPAPGPASVATSAPGAQRDWLVLTECNPANLHITGRDREGRG